MEKEKIIETIERHTSVDSAKKEVTRLKTLLNTTECVISQYQAEINALDKAIKDEEKELELARKEAIAKAKENADNSINENKKKKVQLEKQQKENKKQHYKDVDNYRLIKEEESQALTDSKNFIKEQLKELSKRLEETKNKSYIFRKKLKEQDIKDLENMLKNNKLLLEQQSQLYNNRINEINKEIHELEEKYKAGKENLRKEINELDEENKNIQNNLNNQIEVFNSINSMSGEDWAKTRNLSYFNQDSIGNVMHLLNKIFTYELKKQEKEELLKEKQEEKTNTIDEMNTLNNKIECTLKERKEFKENVEKQAIETINTVKTIIDTNFNQDNTKTKEQGDEYQDNPFDFRSILEESRKETRDFLSDLADEIIDSYANKESNDNEKKAPTIGDAINEAINIFKKRK